MSAVLTPRIWSSYQENVFDWIEHGEGSLVLEACAGAAKTTTLVECARRLPQEDSTIYIAFNKRVADELARRLPASCSAMTLNALGYRAWRGHIEKNVAVEANKVRQLVTKISDDGNADFKSGVKRLVDLAKAYGLVPVEASSLGAKGLVEDNDATWARLIDTYDVFFGEGPDKSSRAIALARRVLTHSIRIATEIIDFGDQLYLPIIFNADFVPYDWVFADELQDFSHLNFEIAARSLAPKGRFVGTGDRSQAIYSWRGAHATAMDDAAKRFNATRLPLSISYRCPKAVVEHARAYNPRIELWENAKEGKVETLAAWAPARFEATDVILCRNNAPLVKMAFRLIRAGKGCKVLGRDIGTGLVALVRRMKALSTSDLRSRLDEHVAKERAKLSDEPEKIISLLDRVDTIKVFVVECGYGASIERLCERIEDMFAEDSPRGYVTLSTIHRAKGCEWQRVYILDAFLIGQRSPEPEVAYVAVTRSQNELYYIES